jgi:hypothetical protein
MKKPSYGVRVQGGFGSSVTYAIDEHYEGEAPRVCTAGHPTRIAAEASAAALQGAIERFAARAASGEGALSVLERIRMDMLVGDDQDLNTRYMREIEQVLGIGPA